MAPIKFQKCYCRHLNSEAVMMISRVALPLHTSGGSGSSLSLGYCQPGVPVHVLPVFVWISGSLVSPRENCMQVLPSNNI